MFQAPFNNVIVKPKTKYIRHISDILKRAAIENNSSVDPVDFVNIYGEIVSIPKAISKDDRHKGFSLKDIRVGDIGIFRYDVIFDLAQTEPDKPIVYKNMISYKGEEYFACDIIKLFGVIRNNKIIMINGYMMITDFITSKIITSAAMKKGKGTSKAQVMHIGNPKETEIPRNIKRDNHVYFNPLLPQKYEINGKKFCIITQTHILGCSSR